MNQSSKDVDKLFPRGEIRDEIINNSRKPQQGKSDVWNFFRLCDPFRYPALKEYAICLKCKIFLKSEKGSTSTLNNHLRSHCLSVEREGLLLTEVRLLKTTALLVNEY